MVRKTGRTQNTNDEANTGSVNVNSNTAKTLIPANPDRVALIVSNNSNKDCWIRFYEASLDNLKKGILLRKESVWSMPNDNIYTGEVSVIMANGGNNTIHFTEY